MSSSKTNKPDAPAAVAPVAKPQRPTPEQLQQISRGGSYVFNPENGKLSSRRAPTKAATVGTKKGAN